MGEIIDFDLLKIKQQLVSTPTTQAVVQRREFVDKKTGIKPKTEIQQPVQQPKKK